MEPVLTAADRQRHWRMAQRPGSRTATASGSGSGRGSAIMNPVVTDSEYYSGGLVIIRYPEPAQ